MRILFNRNYNGMQELKEILGFLYASNDFSEVVAELELVSREVEKIISPEIYALAEKSYFGEALPQGTDEELIAELVKLIQRPVVVDAYLLGAPTRDTIHDNNGRGIHSDEHRKVPFEWMLDREEKALAKRQAMEMDALIAFLIEKVEPFKETDFYKQMMSSVFRSAKEFDLFFPIAQSANTFLHVMPFVRQVEKMDIRSRLKKEAFQELLTNLTAGNLTDHQEEILDQVRVATSIKAMAMAVQRLPFKVLPDGLISHYTGDRITTKAKMPSSLEMRDSVNNALMRDAKNELLKLERLIQELNQDEIPIAPQNSE
ncbi:MAG: hypothetical protein LAT81_15055, partial [Oceanicaulis sp.]|nr:hypothetical protein [Oceanicaulis sp.]